MMRASASEGGRFPLQTADPDEAGLARRAFEYLLQQAGTADALKIRRGFGAAETTAREDRAGFLPHVPTWRRARAQLT